MDRGVWWATVLGVAQIDMTEHPLEHERGGANGRAGPGPSGVEKARQ